MMGGQKGTGSLPWFSGFRGRCCPPGTRVCPFACRAAGGDGARHLPEPRGPAPCEGGNYGCCQAASSPAFKSLKNNLHRMSHLICLAEKQIWSDGVPAPRGWWGLHERSAPRPDAGAPEPAPGPCFCPHPALLPGLEGDASGPRCPHRTPPTVSRPAASPGFILQPGGITVSVLQTRLTCDSEPEAGDSSLIPEQDTW